MEVEPVRSPVECARDGRDPTAFFRTWTRKEALVKATGEGLASPMTAITLAAGGAAVRRPRRRTGRRPL